MAIVLGVLVLDEQASRPSRWHRPGGHRRLADLPPRALKEAPWQRGTLTVGTVQVTAHCDVTGDFQTLAEAFPQVPAAAWAPWRSRHPGAFGGPDRWRLRDWCFVVRARDRVVLVDTGVGGPGAPGAGWIGTPGRLPDELAAAGVEPEEIDLVVLTHLHLDHVGWNLVWDGERPRPRFPRARYLVQRADWDAFAARPEETRVAFDRCVARPGARDGRAAGRGDRDLDAQLRLVHTPGHTPGSQSLLVRSGDDALPSATSPTIRRRSASPTGARAPTSSSTLARATRRRLLDQVESERMARPGPLPRAVRHRHPGRRRPPLGRPQRLRRRRRQRLSGAGGSGGSSSSTSAPSARAAVPMKWPRPGRRRTARGRRTGRRCSGAGRRSP